MKYWQLGSGADAMYARQHDDGRCDYLTADTVDGEEWLESDVLAAWIHRDPSWETATAEAIAEAKAARRQAALATTS